MNTLIILTILALATPIFGEESLEAKNHEKRGIVNVGYGGHYPYAGHQGYSGYTPYTGYGYGHGYSGFYPSGYPRVGYGLNYGLTPSIGHASYSQGYHSPSIYSSLPVGYHGLHNTYNHGYYNGW